VNAGDPDPEGQRLVDEVIEYAGLDGKPVKRVLINDNTPSAIRDAVARIEDNSNYRGLSLSALARAVGDQRYGYNLTRCYTLLAHAKGYDGVLSVGRVQTPILGLVVARDRAHEGHQKQAFHIVTAVADLPENPAAGRAAMTLRGLYQPGADAPLDEKGRVIDGAFARGVAEAVKGQDASLLSVETKDRELAAPLPYNLLALQADAAGLWRYKPKQVLEVTQSLRDRYQAITYNRSDCRYLNDERHGAAAELLAALAGAFGQDAADADPQRKSKAFNSAKVGAHHAIIPTANVPELNALSEPERNLYDLIARSYLAQFYPPEQYRSTHVLFQANNHCFSSDGRVDVAPGWRSLYRQRGQEGGENGDGEGQANAGQVDLERLTAGEKGSVSDAGAKREFTKPPARYAMKTLLKDLAQVAKYVTDPKIRELLLNKDADKADEAGGIGTPATRDAHIETLFQRGFLAEKGGKVISTELGRSFHDALPSFAVKPDMTALWHKKQRLIECGEIDYQSLLADIDEVVKGEISRVRRDGLPISVNGSIQCPACQEGALRRIKGKKGFFWGCGCYPACKAIFPDKRGKPDTAKPAAMVSTEHVCPKCGKGLIRREAAKKKGVYWWGCSGFPACNFHAFDKGGRPVW